MKKVHANLNLVLQVHMAMTLHKNPLARNAQQEGIRVMVALSAVFVQQESMLYKVMAHVRIVQVGIFKQIKRRTSAQSVKEANFRRKVLQTVGLANLVSMSRMDSA